MRKLIHIGYPKAGSCFLGDWFLSHPSFKLSQTSLKSIQSLPSSDISVSVNTSAIGMQNFEVIRDMGFTCADTHDIEMYQTEMCQLLFSRFPGSKIIIITRGYKSILSSFYSQYLKKGGTQSSVQFISRFGSGDNRKNILNYSFVIRLYAGYFGRENVIPVPFELLRDDPDAFLRYIENQLGVEHHVYIPLKKNISLNKDELMKYKKTSVFFKNLGQRYGYVGKALNSAYLKSLHKSRISDKRNFFVKKFNKFGPSEEYKFEIPEAILSKTDFFSEVLTDFPVYSKYFDYYCIR